jgi:hypothetical protein
VAAELTLFGFGFLAQMQRLEELLRVRVGLGAAAHGAGHEGARRRVGSEHAHYAVEVLLAARRGLEDDLAAVIAVDAGGLLRHTAPPASRAGRARLC